MYLDSLLDKKGSFLLKQTRVVNYPPSKEKKDGGDVVSVFMVCL